MPVLALSNGHIGLHGDPESVETMANVTNGKVLRPLADANHCIPPAREHETSMSRRGL